MALGWRDQYLRYREFYLNISALYKQRVDLQAFLEIILSISTVIIFLVFALKPTALTIISLYGQIQEKQKTDAALNQKLSDLQTANATFTANQSVVPDIDEAITVSPKPDIITQQIQGLAAKNSVTILGVSIGEVTLKGPSPAGGPATDLVPLSVGAKEMAVSISVTGDYSVLSAFIKDAEKLRTIINLDAVGINSTSTEQGGATTVALISGRVPYLGQ